MRKDVWRVARVVAIVANGIYIIMFGSSYGYLLVGNVADTAWDRVARATLFFGTMLIGPVLSTVVMLSRPKPG